MNTPIAIKDQEPVFPCWLWHEPRTEWAHSVARFYANPPQRPLDYGYTHWLPDQPEAPTVTPGAAALPRGDAARELDEMRAVAAEREASFPVAKSGEWAEQYLREHFSEEVRLFLVNVRNSALSWDAHEKAVNELLLSFAKHAPVPPSRGEDLARLTKERDEIKAHLDRYSVALPYSMDGGKNFDQIQALPVRVLIACIAATTDQDDKVIAAQDELTPLRAKLAQVEASHKDLSDSYLRLMKQDADHHNRALDLESGLTLAKGACDYCLKEIHRAHTTGLVSKWSPDWHASNQAVVALGQITALLAKPTGASAEKE